MVLPRLDDPFSGMYSVVIGVNKLNLGITRLNEFLDCFGTLVVHHIQLWFESSVGEVRINIFKSCEKGFIGLVF